MGHNCNFSIIYEGVTLICFVTKVNYVSKYLHRIETVSGRRAGIDAAPIKECDQGSAD